MVLQKTLVTKVDSLLTDVRENFEKTEEDNTKLKEIVNKIKVCNRKDHDLRLIVWYSTSLYYYTMIVIGYRLSFSILLFLTYFKSFKK